ncbi:hypothetical protein GCM10010191_53480 [Actinomadura vinacea]|uniref:DUF4132 domain-containing protein n=1 Tax=Actinomadura vinacea TaxID=115336 RepID=A0ABN3JMQ7_9ACTN
MTDPENVLEVPKTWQRRLHPLRGRGRARPVKVERDFDVLSANLAKWTERSLSDVAWTRGGTERDEAAALAAPARAYFDGDITPESAAAAAGVTCAHPRFRVRQIFFTDTWAHNHGIAFAACAFAEWAAQTGWHGLQIDRFEITSPAKTGASAAAHRLRAMLAAASEDQYRDAERRLASRRRTPSQRLVVSYLLPTRRDWVDECCAEPPADPGRRWMLWSVLGAADQLDRLGDWARLDLRDLPAGVQFAVAATVGAPFASRLAEALALPLLPEKRRKELLEILAVLPSDEAFRLLLDRRAEPFVETTLPVAMRRFPVRAARILTDTAGAADLLEQHVRVFPDLPDGASGEDDEAEAPANALPPLLVDPPWTRPRGEDGPAAIIEGLTPPDDRGVIWEADERQQWLELYHYYTLDPPSPDTDAATWQAMFEDFRSGNRVQGKSLAVFSLAPEELVRPLVLELGAAEQAPKLPKDGARAAVARFELDALAMALRSGDVLPLLPLRSPAVARVMADRLFRFTSGGSPASARALLEARKIATRWFERHGTAGAVPLVPDALGEPGERRRAAEWALHHVAVRHGRDVLLETVREVYEPKIAHAVDRLLSSDRQSLVPRRVPKIGVWAEPAVFPRVRLRDSVLSLPRTAIRHLLTVLAMTRPFDPDPGVEPVRELCDPRSLAEFGWAVFERWCAHGMPPADGWALTALGAIGDDETVRRLAPVIRKWPGEGGHARAVKGLGVLAEIGSDLALLHLDNLARTARHDGLRAEARERMSAVAAERRLTSEQLADRLVPDLGLESDGGLTLDYGPRRFVVGFDEQLVPFVTDEMGRPRKSLPKPGARDDPRLAPDAYRRFSELKKLARKAAAEQIGRLEAAMLAQRRWQREEFLSRLVEQPFMWHLARRLVWSSEHEDGTRTFFRLAEDRTCADVNDEAFPLSAQVGIAHPLHLHDTLEMWSDVFADYEIVQPFAQLGRPVRVLTGDEAASGRLKRFDGDNVPVDRLLALERAGWDRHAPGGGGWSQRISTPISRSGRRGITIRLTPGIQAAGAKWSPNQRVEVQIDHKGYMDPVLVSEALLDLERLLEPDD